MESRAKSNEIRNAEADDDEKEEDLIFPEEMSVEEKFEKVLRITKFQRKKIKERDKIIKDLVEQVVRRDRIMELSSAPGDLVEVDKMGEDSEGHRFYEIRNKEKIPYMLKTERLSPTPTQIDWEKLNESEIPWATTVAIDPIADQINLQTTCMKNEQPSVKRESPFESEDEVEVLFQNFVSTSTKNSAPVPREEEEANRETLMELSPQVSRQPDILSPDPYLEKSELPEKQTKVEGKIKTEIASKISFKINSKPTDKLTMSNQSQSSPDLEELSSKVVDQNGNCKKRLRKSSQGNEIDCIQPLEKKCRSERENSFRPSMKVRVSGDSPLRTVTLTKSPENRASSSTRSSRSSSERHNDGLKLKSQVEKVRSKTDGGYRHSFVFSDDLNSTLSKFWNSGPNSWDIKYQIKLHGGQNSDLENQWFTMIQQNDVDPMTKVTIMNRKLDWIERKIVSTFPDANKKIWLELRDFPQILSPSFQTHFNMGQIRGYITHLTLGPRFSVSGQNHCLLDNSGNPDNSKIASNLFLRFILQNLPDLQFLSLHSDALEFSDDKIPLRETQSKFVFKNLVVLDFVRSNVGKKIPEQTQSHAKFSTDFFRKIWRRSPGLKRIYGMPLEILEEFGNGPKSSVRSICPASAFHQLVSGHDYLKHLELVHDVGGQLELEELDTRTFFIAPREKLRVSIMKILSQILEKNAQTLKKIKVEPEGPRSWLKFPVFKNLTTISFCLHADTFQSVAPFFGSGFKDPDFNTSFPNLKRVEILNTSSKEEVDLSMFENCFPSYVFPPSCFTRVESLFLKNFSQPEVVTEITRLFSNVRHLRLYHRLEDVGRILPMIFKGMKKLQQMQLEVDMDGSLDSALTGIEPADLRKLGSDRRFGVFKDQYQLFRRAEEKRIRASILDLPNLSLLRIILRPGQDLDQLSVLNPILSPVSAFFGFGFKLIKSGLQVPLLKVQIAFDESVGLVDKEIIMENLEPMLPYVTLES